MGLARLCRSAPCCWDRTSPSCPIRQHGEGLYTALKPVASSLRVETGLRSICRSPQTAVAAKGPPTETAGCGCTVLALTEQMRKAAILAYKRAVRGRCTASDTNCAAQYPNAGIAQCPDSSHIVIYRPNLRVSAHGQFYTEPLLRCQAVRNARVGTGVTGPPFHAVIARGKPATEAVCSARPFRMRLEPGGKSGRRCEQRRTRP